VRLTGITIYDRTGGVLRRILTARDGAAAPGGGWILRDARLFSVDVGTLRSVPAIRLGADITPDEFLEQVACNFHENDGTPNFGGIFDNGGNSYARNKRHSSGSLAVSGGCGEIYRNFFFLPDRRLTASAVADSFFSRFDRRDATPMFDPRSYTMRICDKILEAIEQPGNHQPLQRRLIEQIYPRVRGRSLFGREISIDARYSPYLLPFLDHRVVAEAMTVPLGAKQAGRFEAQLLSTRRTGAFGS